MAFHDSTFLLTPSPTPSSLHESLHCRGTSSHEHRANVTRDDPSQTIDWRWHHGKIRNHSRPSDTDSSAFGTVIQRPNHRTEDHWLISHRKATGLRCQHHVWHSGRLRLAVLRHAGKQLDGCCGDDTRGLCRVCGRCLRSSERNWCGLRYLLCRRAEFMQFHCGGICGEIACRRDQRSTGYRRASAGSTSASPRSRLQHPVRSLREDHRGCRKARRPIDRISRH